MYARHMRHYILHMGQRLTKKHIAISICTSLAFYPIGCIESKLLIQCEMGVQQPSLLPDSVSKAV